MNNDYLYDLSTGNIKAVVDCIKQLEAENAELQEKYTQQMFDIWELKALRERVAELELQVSLLTSNSVEYIITGSDNTTPLMTEEECRAIFGWQCQRCGRMCYETNCPCEYDGKDE